MTNNKSKILHSLVLLLILSFKITVAKYCEKDEECNTSHGEVCWLEWDGCKRGECMCDPRLSEYDGPTGKCQPFKFGDEECEEGDRCREGMSCKEGRCKCNHGTMSYDKTFCFRSHEKLLGDRCTENDVCYQKAVQEYVRRDVHCSSGGRCRCNHGFRQEGISCENLLVNEKGCRRNHHCQGGALCIDGVCRCPSGYRAVAGNTKCASGAAFYVNIKLGETCDEYDEQAYCAYGLQCRKCPKDNFYTCTRYVLPYHSGSATKIGSQMIYSTFTAVFTSILISLHRFSISRSIL